MSVIYIVSLDTVFFIKLSVTIDELLIDLISNSLEQLIFYERNSSHHLKLTANEYEETFNNIVLFLAIAIPLQTRLSITRNNVSQLVFTFIKVEFL